MCAIYSQADPLSTCTHARTHAHTHTADKWEAGEKKKCTIQFRLTELETLKLCPATKTILLTSSRKRKCFLQGFQPCSPFPCKLCHCPITLSFLILMIAIVIPKFILIFASNTPHNLPPPKKNTYKGVGVGACKGVGVETCKGGRGGNLQRGKGGNLQRGRGGNLQAK